MLTAGVKAALNTDKTTKARQINIETYRGIIQLSGYVGTNEESMQVEKLAASVPGMLEIRNALEIRQRLAIDGARQARNDLRIAPAR